MKKYLIILFLALGLTQGYSQSVVKEGTVFKAVSSRKVTKDTIITKYSYQDKKGNNYPIILNKKSGACYIWAKSKDGKSYPRYLPEVAAQISKEYGVTYKPKK